MPIVLLHKGSGVVVFGTASIAENPNNTIRSWLTQFGFSTHRCTTPPPPSLGIIAAESNKNDFIGTWLSAAP